MGSVAVHPKAAYAALAALVALAAVLTPGSAAAQGWAVDRAEGMEAEAGSLADQRSEWRKAAWLYRSAASLRPAGDPEAVLDLQMAGRLSWYIGAGGQALRDLEDAAERAMEGGDVFTAANLLVDAAWVATRLGSYGQAVALTREARAHAQSPVLSDAVRRRVTDRVIDLTSATLVALADGSDIRR